MMLMLMLMIVPKRSEKFSTCVCTTHVQYHMCGTYMCTCMYVYNNYNFIFIITVNYSMHTCAHVCILLLQYYIIITITFITIIHLFIYYTLQYTVSLKIHYYTDTV